MSDVNGSADPADGSGGEKAGAEEVALNAIIRIDEALSAAVAGHEQEEVPDWLCRAVVDVLAVDGAAISVYLGADMAVPIGASDQDATAGEALQFTVREGPCFESYSSRRPVLVSDIHDRDSPAWARWPTYAAAFTEHTPYQGVFAYPLLANGIAMGSLSLYRRVGGQPSYLNQVNAIAARTAERLLEAELLRSPEGGDPLSRWLDGLASQRRRRVWQAQGLTVQANRVTPGQAIDLLRAHAFTTNRTLDDVAEDVVAGRLPIPVIHQN